MGNYQIYSVDLHMHLILAPVLRTTLVGPFEGYKCEVVNEPYYH